MTLPGTGTVLRGRYRLGEKIGEGGAGAIYEALQLDLGREVAVKLLRPELSLDGELRARLRREARAAASLAHPNVALVHDFHEPSDGEPGFIAMELLRAPTLQQVLAGGGRLPLPRAVTLILQLLSALEAAHRAGVVHRDVKPSNLVLVSVPGLDERLKVIDFGIAHVAADARLTRTGSVMGTPRYMAPEQLRGESVDARADVWAAGVVLYRALGGRVPFEGRGGSTIEAILGAEPAPLDPSLNVPPHVERAIRRALEKRPAARWPSAAAFAEALQREPLPPTRPARRAAPLPRVPELHRGDRAGLLTLLALVAAAAFAIAFTIGLAAAAAWALAQF